ncbi:hypothetical protein C2G38_2209803 [Gigaspora rosea]|uniref:Uncharacterized protein n=1 Tax=Gigaspora rosea TaxID=44941 RepID=A0A397UIP2_9GLOM|nr:hypothetical protein C2G38_2209803 [Gigaspora rosea]
MNSKRNLEPEFLVDADDLCENHVLDIGEDSRLVKKSKIAIGSNSNDKLNKNSSLYLNFKYNEELIRTNNYLQNKIINLEKLIDNLTNQNQILTHQFQDQINELQNKNDE